MIETHTAAARTLDNATVSVGSGSPLCLQATEAP
jgi:hypothetical protein